MNLKAEIKKSIAAPTDDYSQGRYDALRYVLALCDEIVTQDVIDWLKTRQLLNATLLKDHPQSDLDDWVGRDLRMITALLEVLT